MSSERVEESESHSVRPCPEENKQEEEQINYYNEYCRLYLANHVLAAQLKELNLEKAELVCKLQKLEVVLPTTRKRQKNSQRATAGRSTRRSAGSGDQQSTLLGTTSAKWTAAQRATVLRVPSTSTQSSSIPRSSGATTRISWSRSTTMRRTSLPDHYLTPAGTSSSYQPASLAGIELHPEGSCLLIFITQHIKHSLANLDNCLTHGLLATPASGTSYTHPLQLDSQPTQALRPLPTGRKAPRCSRGQFLRMAARSAQLQSLVGVDIQDSAIQEAVINTIPQQIQSSIQFDRIADLAVKVFQGDLLQPHPQLKHFSFDMVTLIEVIEHLPLQDVPKATSAIFGYLRPKIVAVTTPNREFNVHFRDKGDRLRHWDHKFQWTRIEFHQYCTSVQEDYGYNFELSGIGEHVSDPSKGCCTQLAVFTLSASQNHRPEALPEDQHCLKLRASYLINCWRSNLDSNMKDLFFKGLSYREDRTFKELAQQIKEEPLVLCLQNSGQHVDENYLRDFVSKFSDCFEWDSHKYWPKPLESESEEIQEDILMDECPPNVSNEDLSSFGFGDQL